MKIALIGDIALNDLISNDELNTYHRFSSVSDILKKYDFTIGNLEFPITDKCIVDKQKFNSYKIRRYCSPFVFKKVSEMLNLKLVTLANNHILDYGKEGVESTLYELKRNNVMYSGLLDKKAINKPTFFETNGKRIYVFSYVFKTTHPPIEHDNSFSHAIFERNEVIKEIKKIKKKESNSLVLLSLHWGKDYSCFFENEQQDTARALISAGADLIWGHHPHTIQAFEVFKQKYIFYSLGGLCYGDFLWEGNQRALRRKTKRGMIIIINEKGSLEEIIATKEKKGNIINIKKRDLETSLAKRYVLNKLRNKVFIIKLILNVWEKLFSRICEYFFGYYRNPLKQLILIVHFRMHILKMLRK